MSQFQRPNNRNHIALAYGIFNNDSINNEPLQEILSLLKNNAFNLSFTYGIYTDQNFVKENLFMPIFHTYYLNSDSKYVVLTSELTYDLPYVYTHHKYLLYGDKTKTLKDFEQLKTLYSTNIEIQQIESFKEIYDNEIL